MRKTLLVSLILVMLLGSTLPAFAQGGPGTQDFYIRDFGACINLPDFTVVSEPDAYNTLYTVPGLFEINFAQFLLPLGSPPTGDNDLYNAMIALLNTVSASNYQRVSFNHPEYNSAAVEFTLDGKRMFGMIYRNQNGTLFFLFADKVVGFDMLAIGRAIFAADGQCTPHNLPPVAHDQVIGNPNDVVITEVQNIPAAQISLTAANGDLYDTTITGGQCATIQWDVDNAQAVYFEGQGVTGHASTQVCPTSTQAYTLVVHQNDGSQATRQIVVIVIGTAENTDDSRIYRWDLAFDGYESYDPLCPNETITVEWWEYAPPPVDDYEFTLEFRNSDGSTIQRFDNVPMPGRTTFIPGVAFSSTGRGTIEMYATSEILDHLTMVILDVVVASACF